MSVTRVDPLTGFRVIVAPGRRKIGASRPAGLPQPSTRCPFCPGHETDTERSVLALGDPWRVRVVANRYPLTIERGAHEVVIEHRAHDRDLADYAPEHALEVLTAVQRRIAALEEGARSVVFFRNRGRRAGSSQPHPHAQIVALPEVTPSAAARAQRAQDPSLRLAAVLAREAASPIASAGPFVAWCPPASERAFHVRIASSEPWPRFSAISPEALADLSSLLPRVVAAALEVSGTADYNLLLRDPPVGQEHASFFFDLLPRTGGDAGFELGSGIGVCTVEPSEAAADMRTLLAGLR